MAHQSLYRKYRPQTFSDVVGQEHIERTLRNAVAEGTVAHAYLFTGPRGTGKTTTARILAKALNCDHGPTADPDGTCPQCIEIAEGRHPDVYELDAASRTGVDNVREEIIGRVQFAPTKGRYKVYIIDEVHMLSTAAFNALLKTLEEPPSHVIFVMATTHPHKVPETIQSRCQRFDFRRIGIDDIAGRLRTICEGEGFDVPDAALALIARHAAGGMRDAITTLEQLASFTGGSITLDDVEGLLGEVDSAQLFEIAGLVARRDIAGCFRWVARFAEEGTDLAEFVRELTGHVRNLYLIAAVGDATGIVDVSAEDHARLVTQAAEFGGPDRLARVLVLLGELGAEMRWSSDPRLSLEVALTRMARPDGEMTLEALAERVEALEAGAPVRAMAPPVVASAPAPAPATPAAPEPAPARKAAQASAEVSATPPAPEPEPQPAHPVVASGALDRAAVRRAWPAVLVEIKKLKSTRAQQYAQVEVDIDADGETLVLEFPSDQAIALQMADEPEMRDIVNRALGAVLGMVPPTRLQLGQGAVRPPEPEPLAASGDPYAAALGAQGDPAPDPATDPVPAPAAAPAAPPASGREPASDLERLLVEGLGAQIVGEREGPATAVTGEASDAAADDESAPAAEYVSADLGLLDPELYDETDRED